MHSRKRKRGDLKTEGRLVTARQKSACSSSTKQDPAHSSLTSEDAEASKQHVDTCGAFKESRLTTPLLGCHSEEEPRHTQDLPVMSPVSAALGKHKHSFDFDISATQVSMSPPLLLLSEDTLSSVTSQLANCKDPNKIAEAGGTRTQCSPSLSQVRVDSPLLLPNLTNQIPVSHSIFDEYSVLPDETSMDSCVQEGLAVSNGCGDVELFPADLAGSSNSPVGMPECNRPGPGVDQFTSELAGTTLKDANSHTHDPTISVKCQQCRRCFGSVAEKDTHISEEHNSIACLTCGAQVIGLKNYMSHMETHMQDSNSRCECCLATFLHPYSLLKHLEKVHWNSVKGLCEICGFRNRTKGKHFETHMPKTTVKYTPVPKVPTSDTPHSSQASKNEPRNPIVVNSHKSTDTQVSLSSSLGGKTNVTAKAGEAGKGPSKGTHTNGESEKISICLYCSKCDDVFTTESQWRRHQMYMHSGFKCVTCAETVCGFAAYQVHVSKHVNLKLPGRVCQEPSVLQKHMVVESKPADTALSKGSFKCSTCGMVCATAAEYSSHMYVHLEASEHQCKDCGRRFMHQSSLQAHVRLKCNNSHTRKAQ